MRQTAYCILFLAIAGILAACQTPPEQPPGAALFIPRISDNGSKFFIYSMAGPGAGQHPPGQGSARGGGTMGGPGNGGSPGMIRGQNKPTPRANGAMLEQGLEALLNNNHYCREGYMILERRQQSIRGECQESATAEDRERFTNPDQPPIEDMQFMHNDTPATKGASQRLAFTRALGQPAGIRYNF